MINAIILAGDHNESSWNDKENKALLRINGRLMIEYVIEAFKKVENVDKIIVVGCKQELEPYILDNVNAVIDAEGSIMDNVLAGIKHLGSDKPLLVSSCDIPLITPEALKDFIEKARSQNADFCYPIVEKNVNESMYPEFERTYVKVKEGVFTGGNIFYLNPCSISRGYELAGKLLDARKNPLKMAGIVSPGFLAQLMMGVLSIEKIEKKFSELMGIKAKAIVSEYPEIGNDVDKPSDVIVVTAHLSQ